MKCKTVVSISTRTYGAWRIGTCGWVSVWILSCLIWFEFCQSIPSERTNNASIPYHLLICTNCARSSCLWELCKLYFFRLAGSGPGVLFFISLIFASQLWHLFSTTMGEQKQKKVKICVYLIRLVIRKPADFRILWPNGGSCPHFLTFECLHLICSLRKEKTSHASILLEGDRRENDVLGFIKKN